MVGKMVKESLMPCIFSMGAVRGVNYSNKPQSFHHERLGMICIVIMTLPLATKPSTLNITS